MRLPPWHAHPDVWLLFASIAAAYLLAVRRHERETGEPTARRTVRLFLAGVAVLWVGADWPIHDLAERYLYLMHMVQHLLFALVGAPLLLAGVPAWMLRRLIAPRPVGAAVRLLTRPVVALALFNGILLFTHWPAVVEASVRSEWLHFSLHVALVGSALAMWFPILSPLAELPPLPAPGQCLYLFVQSLAPTIPASFLTFGTRPLYPVYATFPRIWGIGVLTDQLIAGLIMKLVGGAILWACITVIFFRWHRQEELDGVDALEWRRLERQVTPGLRR